MIYTGIGSRETPDEVLDQMYTLGMHLGQFGFTLRSGGAGGADTAFEEGSDAVDGEKEIYLPWRGFNDRTDGIVLELPPIKNLARKIAMNHHPAWHRLTEGGRALHTRNVPQVLGRNITTPSDFVLCWTPDGRDSGGTGTAIRIANGKGIPVYNLKNEADLRAIEALFEHD